MTDEFTSQLPELKNIKIGLLHLFIQHTSCALSLNENWDPDVQRDMSDALDRIVVEDKKDTGIYRHSAEGSDDMPAHIKSALVGASVSVPIKDGRLALGTWQGEWCSDPGKGRVVEGDTGGVEADKRDRDLVFGVQDCKT